MVRIAMTDPVPTEAATAAYAEFQRLYPQRSAPWEELAEWERERWRRILEAAAPLIALSVQKWMTLDLWTALDHDSTDCDGALEEHGWAEIWARLLAEVRERARKDRELDGLRRENEHIRSQLAARETTP
jgi:hypothetical protein